MKRIAQIVFVILSASSAHAQLGFEAGLNMANLSIKSGGQKVQSTYVFGACGGVSVGVALDPQRHVYFAPEFLFEQDGAKGKGGTGWSTEINSITIPLFLEYRTGTRCSSRAWIGVGPYLRDNLGGSSDITVSGNLSTAGSTDLTPGVNIQRLDFGLGFNAGIIPGKHWYFRLKYLYGFANNLPGGDNQNYIKQETGSVTIGYMFRGCRVRRSKGESTAGEYGHWRGLKKGRWSWKPRIHRANGPDAY